MAEPASTIGRYEILREIGRGAMGIVYEAHDPVLDRTIALKVIQPSAEGEAARVFEERFLAEARIAAALQHPGIVVVHDVGRDSSTGALFIALELLRGRTLADLGAEGPLDWRTVLHLVAQVARALHHAHLHGVVHRDVKPANVVVLPSGEVKVMDFGIARLETARHRLTTTGEFIGTPLYTAPEQARTEDVDGRADVFSLASVAYTLLTGRAAFIAPTIPGIVHRVVYEEPEPPSRFVRDLPADVEHVLARALAKDPARRYPTAEAFAEDVEDVLEGRPPRHAAGDDLVVVEEPDSPLSALLDPATVAPAPAPPPPFRPLPARPAPSCPSICPAAGRGAAWSSRASPWASAPSPSSSGARGAPRPLRPAPSRRGVCQHLRPPRRPPRRPSSARSLRSCRTTRAACGSTSTTRSRAAPSASSWTTSWPSRSGSRGRSARRRSSSGCTRARSATSSTSRPAFTRCGWRSSGTTT